MGAVRTSANRKATPQNLLAPAQIPALGARELVPVRPPDPAPTLAWRAQPLPVERFRFACLVQPEVGLRHRASTVFDHPAVVCDGKRRVGASHIAMRALRSCRSSSPAFQNSLSTS